MKNIVGRYNDKLYENCGDGGSRIGSCSCIDGGSSGDGVHVISLY